MFITIIQITTGILLMISILLQNTGTGLGSAFGDSNSISHTKRGAEKFLFYTSIVLATIFLATSLLNVLL